MSKPIVNAQSTSNAGNTNAIADPRLTKTIVVKSVITISSTASRGSGLVTEGIDDDEVRPAVNGMFWDDYRFSLELVSNDLDSNGNMKTVIAHTKDERFDSDKNVYTYTCEFNVPGDFGKIGAVLVENDSEKMMFLKTIDIHLVSIVTITCESWIPTKSDVPGKRTFFTNKSYLPLDTPQGLKSLRNKDLESLRGSRDGECKSHDRIYDYDVYNDLGAPDKESKLARPVLGGQTHPYPRRCRTGRKMSHKDPLTEIRTNDPFYTPYDEDFSDIKNLEFTASTKFSFFHGVIPILKAYLTDEEKGFSSFTDINLLYNEGVKVIPCDQGDESILDELKEILPWIIKLVVDEANYFLKFETPATMARDTFSWLRDEEFCRQMLAGVNPCSIQLVTEWPLMSKLDPKIYGSPESAITKEIVQEQIGVSMTFDEALAQKKLFMLDYHDMLLPYVNNTRDLKGATHYGSRTLMFLTPAGVLQPLVIELTRPPYDGKPQWKHVYTPTSDATGAWLWKLAKAHVLSHDSGYHQLVSHWLRSHCVTEPYIIATHRHLSQMHPIKRLMLPHFRNTIKINALARFSLINAGGIIESSFSPGEYCMQLSSDAYDQLWRFDREALPADLISRGMAVEDPSAPHGLKLTIEDYPFANDGLLIYDAIKQWVTSYVNHYYPQPNLIESDEELQAWWNEIRTVGHADKKDEPWWPKLETPDDLTGIVSTIIWVASGHHSAVNFGQYEFAGYFPNRPSTARTKMPNENPTDKEWQSFIEQPEGVLLNCFPTPKQAITVLAVIDVLSSHSPDEEYIGRNIEPTWEAEPAIKEAFEEFQGKIKQLAGIIDSRNSDPHLRNRNGAGVVSYQLLKPYSHRGVTGRGVPNSISI